MKTEQQNPPLPPEVQLVQMATGHWVSQIVFAAAKLNIADHLAQGPKNAEALAGPTKTHAPSLYRLMRTLASLGILTEDDSHKFALTPLGEALKTGAPGSARPAVLTLASELWVRGVAQLTSSVETGKPGFENILGMNIFEHFAKHPDEASMFSETMVAIHGVETPAVAEAYDFTGLKTIVDVGGATGNLLAAVLAKNPTCRGILYDLPHVVKDAPALLKNRGVADRVTIESGSFFDKVPAGGDAYMLSHIIHDWDETKCLTILGNCRKALGPSSRLLIIEMVLPPGNVPHPGKLLDMMMLVGPGGQERTEQEYRPLLAKAGLRLTRVVPTKSPVSVVEAMLA